MYHRKNRILFKSLYNSTGYKSSKIISQQGARFLRKLIDLINPQDNHGYLHLSHIQYDNYQNPSSYTFFRHPSHKDMLKLKKGHNSASTHPTEKEKKYGSANFHSQLIYETSKLFHICFINSVSSLRRTYMSTKQQLSGSCSSKLDNTENEQAHNSVKIKKKA